MTFDRQAFFDRAVRGIRTQGALAGIPGGACFYREPDTGHKCAVGWSIPDEAYSPAFEMHIPGFKGDDTSKKLALAAGLEEGADTVFALRVQSLHDNSETVPEFLHKAEGFAIALCLSFPAE